MSDYNPPEPNEALEPLIPINQAIADGTLPISLSNFYAGIAIGKYPLPIKIGRRNFYTPSILKSIRNSDVSNGSWETQWIWRDILDWYLLWIEHAKAIILEKNYSEFRGCAPEWNRVLLYGVICIIRLIQTKREPLRIIRVRYYR